MFNEDTIAGRECFSITIIDDDALEESESFQVTLQPGSDTVITFVDPLLIVMIIDDDSKSSSSVYFLSSNVFCLLIFNVFCLLELGVSVTFVEDYTVGEQEGMFDVCVTLNGATDIDVTVMLLAQENNQLPPSTRAMRE